MFLAHHVASLEKGRGSSATYHQWANCSLATLCSPLTLLGGFFCSDLGAPPNPLSTLKDKSQDMLRVHHRITLALRLNLIASAYPARAKATPCGDDVSLRRSAYLAIFPT